MSIAYLASQSDRFAAAQGHGERKKAGPLASRLCKERQRASERPARRAQVRVSSSVGLLALTLRLLLFSPLYPADHPQMPEQPVSSNSPLNFTMSSPPH